MKTWKLQNVLTKKLPVKYTVYLLVTRKESVEAFTLVYL